MTHICVHLIDHQSCGGYYLKKNGIHVCPMHPFLNHFFTLLLEKQGVSKCFTGKKNKNEGTGKTVSQRQGEPSEVV